MDRHAIALVLEEIATLLDASGDNRFKARAFRTAARALEKAGEDPRTLMASGELRNVPGIGPATARIIEELVVTGSSEYHSELRGRAPSGMRELLSVPGLGPKKIAQLHSELGITDLDSLEAAARSGRIAEVRGFGPATEQRVLNGIEFARGLAGRRRFHQAEEVGVRLAGFIDAIGGVDATYMAGELRRRLEIVDAIVLVCVADDAAPVARRIRAASGLSWYPGDDRTVHGRFGDGLRVEICITARGRAGAALLHLTGSDVHLTALRRVAEERGVQLSPEGVEVDGRIVDTPDEESVYAALGLPFIPAELREDGREVIAALDGTLPELVELDDLRGCFHCHTTYSDGKASIQEMAEGAIERGWRYLGIADHSRNAGYAGGLSTAQIRRQQREIDRWNRERGDELLLLKGIEADILADGSLDYAEDDGVLESFDYVIGSVHSLFRMERAKMTTRMVAAVSDPRITMLGHARGRLLLIRDGYDVDIDAVIRAASDAGTAIEINADPHRLDLSWQHWPLARSLGVRTAVNPDAHSVRGIGAVRYGINIARKAWLTREDVINAWPVEDVVAYLTERKQRFRGKAK